MDKYLGKCPITSAGDVVNEAELKIIGGRVYANLPGSEPCILEIPWALIHAAVEWHQLSKLDTNPDVTTCPNCAEYFAKMDLPRHLAACSAAKKRGT